MAKKFIEKKPYLIRASAARKKWGGIWALDAFITLQWHKLNLLPDVVERVRSNGNLEIIPFEGNEDKEYLTEEETRFATRSFPKNPTILQSVLSNDGDEEEEEEDVELDETEKTADSIEEIMRKQEAHFGVDTEEKDENLTKKARKVKSGKDDPVDEILEE